MGLALVPALITVYPRLTMPEGKKYLESRELNTRARPNSVTSTQSRSTVNSRTSRAKSMNTELIVSDGRGLQEEIDAARAEIDAQGRRARLDVFLVYFRQWRHLKTLISTASTWFLLDVAFYGTNLNQSVILSEIGYSSGRNEFDMLKRNAVGNIIIAVAGYVPGYFAAIYFIEKLGRRWIQIQGFLLRVSSLPAVFARGVPFGSFCQSVEGLFTSNAKLERFQAFFFAVIAGGYDKIGTAGKFVCLAFAQVGPLLFLHHPNGRVGSVN